MSEIAADAGFLAKNLRCSLVGATELVAESHVLMDELRNGLNTLPAFGAGIDTLTAAVGRDAPYHGSDRSAALPPDDKRLGPKRLEDAARKEVALDVEGVLNSGVDRQEALGGSRGLEPLLLSLSSPNRLM
jgi:hypothetical protein